MRRLFTFFRSSIGMKVVMAVTGLILVLFVIGHMVGNLKVFQGPEKFDAYAEFLREVGYPLVGHGQLLWVVRTVLLISVIVHIAAAVQLTRMGVGARPVRYRRWTPDASTYASRTMRWGGVIIFAFVVYHLLHLTFGTAHPDFVAGAAFHNVVVAFRVWPVTAAYVVATVALGFHLYHGAWSVFQSLGGNHPDYNRYRRPLAGAVAVAVTLGFMAVPIAVVTGLVR